MYFKVLWHQLGSSFSAFHLCSCQADITMSILEIGAYSFQSIHADANAHGALYNIVNGTRQPDALSLARRDGVKAISDE